MAMRVLVFAAVVLGFANAHAAMMLHYDLAGLVLKSDTIVTADKLGPGRYRITRVVRGGAKVGDELAIYDGLYNTTGETVDPSVYLFLEHGTDGKSYLVSSGMRVIAHGKVYRFEQWNNPGGFEMVPQGPEPGHWRNPGPIDVATFEHALGDAIRKVNAFAILRALPDPAQRRAMLLLLLDLPGSHAQSFGFYSNALAGEVSKALADGGDLEGALLAFARGGSARFGTLPELAAIAKNPGKSIDLRVSALAMARHQFGLYEDAAAVHAAISLFDDPEPRIRIAAIDTASQTLGVTSSDAKVQATIDKLAREARAAMAARFAKETDNDVVFVLAEELGDAAPPRTGSPIVAVAGIELGTIVADVRCVRRGLKYRDGKVLATRDGKPVADPAFKLSYRCGKDDTGTFTTAAKPLPAGRYDVSIELDLDGHKLVLPEGTMVSD
jgi:hypothetical protein